MLLAMNIQSPPGELPDQAQVSKKIGFRGFLLVASIVCGVIGIEIFMVIQTVANIYQIVSGNPLPAALSTFLSATFELAQAALALVALLVLGRQFAIEIGVT